MAHVGREEDGRHAALPDQAFDLVAAAQRSLEALDHDVAS